MKRRLTYEERLAVLKDWKDGVSASVIAKRYRVGPTYARVLARRHGVSRQDRRGWR